jgi:hypothetical protein
MAEKSSNQKTMQSNTQDSHQVSTAGPDGEAIAPPTYGIDFLDQGSTIQRKAKHTGLPDRLKSGVESLSGLSLDGVQMHTNSSKPAQLQALAYAQGSDIHLGPGQERHLPHEAWHIVQQKQGRVQPTIQIKAGVPANDGEGLEHEADAMGVMATRNASQSKSLPLQKKQAGTVLQMKKKPNKEENDPNATPIHGKTNVNAKKKGDEKFEPYDEYQKKEKEKISSTNPSVSKTKPKPIPQSFRSTPTVAPPTPTIPTPTAPTPTAPTPTAPTPTAPTLSLARKIGKHFTHHHSSKLPKTENDLIEYVQERYNDFSTHNSDRRSYDIGPVLTGTTKDSRQWMPANWTILMNGDNKVFHFGPSGKFG